MASKKVSAKVAADSAAFNAATQPAPVAPVSRTSYGLTIKALKPADAVTAVKMATQAKLVFTVIAKHGAKGVTETELAKELKPAGLVTRQDPLRIYRFYRKMLVTGGYIATA